MKWSFPLSRYKKYVLLDPLGVVTKIRTTFEDTDEGLADAPSTILQREELNRQVAENYFFVPGMGHVPEIAVPDFLPDLVGQYRARMCIIVSSLKSDFFLISFCKKVNLDFTI